MLKKRTHSVDPSQFQHETEEINPVSTKFAYFLHFSIQNSAPT